MWQKIKEILEQLRRWTRRGLKDRRVATERARFWAEVREGERDSEREAEARSET